LNLGDTHIYRNHFDQVREQLGRSSFPAPTLHLNPGIRSIDDFRYEDILLKGYQFQPGIKAPISV
jgi:thymidylate synthase